MRKIILLAAALSLTATPALARNGTATAILGVVAGTGLGLAIADHHQRPAYYQGNYGQPAYAPPPPPPTAAPNGVYCMGWNGYRYVPVSSCR